MQKTTGLNTQCPLKERSYHGLPQTEDDLGPCTKVRYFPL